MPDIVWSLTKAFVVGGALCCLGEVILLKTRLTNARILVGYVVAGVVLGAIGLYKPLVDFAGGGASIPLTGFGNALVSSVMQHIEERGWIGAFTGGLSGTAAGVAAAIVFGFFAALLFPPKMKV